MLGIWCCCLMCIMKQWTAVIIIVATHVCWLELHTSGACLLVLQSRKGLQCPPPLNPQGLLPSKISVLPVCGKNFPKISAGVSGQNAPQSECLVGPIICMQCSYTALVQSVYVCCILHTVPITELFLYSTETVASSGPVCLLVHALSKTTETAVMYSHCLLMHLLNLSYAFAKFVIRM